MSKHILEALVVTAEMTGTSLSEPTIRGMLIELADYPDALVLNALSRCRRELKHKLTLADILERLVKSDGRISADEAWAKAMIGFDESASVVLNEEIVQAMEVARPIIYEGDKVGARMAFKDAYDRIVYDAREQGLPVKWFASLGHEKTGRKIVVEEAVRIGLLPPSSIQTLLPPPENPEAVKLIGNAASQVIEKTKTGLESIAELKRMLSNKTKQAQTS